MAQTVKVKIVEYGEDLKVKLVDYGEDIRIIPRPVRRKPQG